MGRKRKFFWLAGLGCLVLLVAGGYGLYYIGSSLWGSFMRQAGISPETLNEINQVLADRPKPPQAGVHVGQKLAWRKAVKAPLLDRFIGQALTGQFDSDSDTEMLFISTRGRSKLVQPDGQSQPVRVTYPIVWDHWVAWDYDGDGKDEVVPTCSVSEYQRPYATPQQLPGNATATGQPNLSQLTPVLDLNGKVVAQLFGQGLLGLVVGRFDGTAPQLVLQDMAQPGRSKRIFYGPQGVKVGSITVNASGLRAQAGDIDGDGQDELVEQYSGPGDSSPVRAFSLAHKPRDLYQAGFTCQFHVLDVTGDGTADVFTSWGSYRDLATGHDVPLQLPPGLPAPGYDDFGTSCIASGDFLGTGKPQIALGYGPAVGITSVMLFELDGTCLYYEEFGRDGDSLVKLSAGGKDIMCVTLDNCILMYP